MALLNYTAPFLGAPSPPAPSYYQPPAHYDAYQTHQQGYSYPPPQKPFLAEEYPAYQRSPPGRQEHRHPGRDFRGRPGYDQDRRGHDGYNRVRNGGTKSRVPVDYDYEEEVEEKGRRIPVTPIQGPIYIKNGSIPVVPLYSYPVLSNGTFVQIPILWTALSVALGLELKGGYIRGVPCIIRDLQLYCPTAGNSYPLDRIESFIDENKALMKRMYGEFDMPYYDDSYGQEGSYGPGEGRRKRSAKPGVPDLHTDPGPDPVHSFEKLFSKNRSPRQNFRNNQSSESGRIDSCESKIEIVTPFWASNSAGKIRAIVNTQHFEQAIHQEVCARQSTKRCQNDCGCEQKYKWHRLLAYDPQNDCRGIFMDWFLFPSCCVCRCAP
ncbi:unnamed protein product [Phyllotreta striolata]|uniref:Spaetzle domain-containing protein n=1 Tax=Phyllotreta striolata TaxID=444603 RepID=A0A9N9TQN1_PHYSR|nr:unnamed protein product [Phyllotreta striolata]